MLLAGLLAKGRPQEYHAEDHSDESERIGYGTCHSHPVGSFQVVRCCLKKGLLAFKQGDLNAAMGTLYTMKGDYAAAKSAYGQTATNNAAVQQILDEDYAAARQTLAKVDRPNATTAYLAAIVGARTNDAAAVAENLKKAVKLDSSLAKKAANDMEFVKYASALANL